MKWKIESLYKVKINFNSEMFSIKNLIYNYQPLIGSEAISFYLFLFAEATNGITSSIFLSQERIIKITGLSREEIILVISKLELFSLLDLYYSAEDERLIYVLKEPAELDYLAKDFLTDYLVNKIGFENSKINEAFLSSKSQSQILEGYQLVSKPIKNITKYRKDNTNIELNIDLNLNHLLKFMGQNGINYSAWMTQDLKKSIESSMIIYNLDFMDVFLILKEILVNSRLVTKETYFDFVKKTKSTKLQWIDASLKDKSINSKKFNLLKILTPEQFINLRLKRSMTKEEEQVINVLKNQFRLGEDFINIILDFTILKNGDNITQEYILDLAKNIQKVRMDSSLNLVEYLRRIHNKKGINSNSIFYEYDDDETKQKLDEIAENSEYEELKRRENLKQIEANKAKELENIVAADKTLDDIDQILKNFLDKDII